MSDETFLRSTTRPDYEQIDDPVVVVDLFAGCGGLTLGLAEAARALDRGIDIALAVDFDADIAAVYGHNFPKAQATAAPVEALFDGELGSEVTRTERQAAREIDRVDWLVGGPPCQGHSDLNNHTRRDDPRNSFYERMARAAEVLTPSVVVIENVPPVRNDKGNVVDRATDALESAGYVIADAVVSFDQIGVAQRRRRHTVLGVKDPEIDPDEVLAELDRGPERDLRWAIGDLEGIEEPRGLDKPSRVMPDNVERIDWLFDNDAYDLSNDMRPPCHQGDHSYVSMYGRLHWDKPAQTLTSGYGSMGQGRYVHPSERRTLTPHEAARIQFFPDWFDFTAGGRVIKRSTWATMIGNAVPPKLTLELGLKLIPLLRKDED